MTEIEELPAWCMRLGDCRDWQWSADVMIVDPPYREHVHKSATSQIFHSGDSYKPGCVQHRDMGFDHRSKDIEAWIAKVATDHVKRWSCIFTDVESIGAWVELLGSQYVRTIPWVRWSMPQMSGDRPPQGWEALVIAHGKAGGRKHWNGPGNFTHFAQRCLRGKNKHKAEKPLDLMLDVVSWFSDSGETVIDPMCGAGTTGMACRLLKRDFLGCEESAEWFGKATARLNIRELSALDAARYERWKIANEAVEAHKQKMAAHTARVRARISTGHMRADNGT